MLRNVVVACLRFRVAGVVGALFGVIANVVLGASPPPSVYPITPPSTVVTQAWGCPRERHAFHGRLQPGANFFPSRKIWASAGDRLVAASVGSPPNAFSPPFETHYWEIQIGSWDDRTGFKTLYASQKYDGDRVLLDVAAPHSGWFMARIRHSNANVPGAIFHAVFDVSDPGECGPPGYQLDFCFGGVGSNCGEGTIAGLPYRSDVLPTGMRRMEVNVGSMLHDSCCSRNPLGVWCQGSPFGQGCGTEMDIAIADQLARPRRNFSQVFNPAIPTYPPHTIAVSTQHAAWPLRRFPDGLTFPDGHAINPLGGGLTAGAFPSGVSGADWCSGGTLTKQNPQVGCTRPDCAPCCGASPNCPLDGTNTLARADCTLFTTVRDCDAAPGCGWYLCKPESTFTMVAGPVCLPKGTAIDVACPTQRTKSCRQRKSMLDCLAAAPRCIWVQGSRLREEGYCQLDLSPPGT